MDAARPVVTVVGLGPGGRAHVTVETLDAIARIPHRYLRTARHPSADLVPDAVTFDDLYETADRFDDVYAAIVEALVAAAGEHGEVLYAVPGSPLVLERSVRVLLADERVRCDVLPAMSFLDLVWARLGIDPVESAVRLIDGHEFALAAAGSTGAAADHPHACRLGPVGHQAGRRGGDRRRAGRDPAGPRHAERADHPHDVERARPRRRRPIT